MFRYTGCVKSTGTSTQMGVAVSRYMPHPQNFVQFLLDVFFTCSENFIILSLFKIDLWQHQQKKFVSKKVDLAHLVFYWKWELHW